MLPETFETALDIPIVDSVVTMNFFWGAFFPGSILTGSIFFWGAFCFGEHFLESILRGALGGEHFFREHLFLHRVGH